MEFSAIDIGKEYAVRLRVPVGRAVGEWSEFSRRFSATTRWKVQHVDEPHVGMEEFFPQRNFIVAWGEARAFLRDEQRMTSVCSRSAEVYDAVTRSANPRLDGLSTRPQTDNVSYQ